MVKVLTGFVGQLLELLLPVLGDLDGLHLTSLSLRGIELFVIPTMASCINTLK